MENSNVQKLCEKSVYVYIFMMFSIFLLYFKDGFYDIQRAKFLFFSVITICFLVITCLLLISRLLHRSSKSGSFLNTLTSSDKAVLLLMICVSITTLMSDYPQASFFGSQGRWMGLLFYLLIGGAYFIITRFYKQEQSIYLVYLFSCCLVSVLALLNFFDIDVLGFYKELSDNQSRVFLSTIGNLDFVGSLVCLFLPLPMVWYCYSDHTLTKIIYLLCVSAGSVLMIVSNADCAYLGIGAFLLIYFYVASDNIQTLKRFLMTLIIMFAAFRITGILAMLFQTQAHPFYTLSSEMAVRATGSWLLFIVCVLYYFLYRYEKSQKPWNTAIIRKWLKIAYLMLFSVLIGLILYFTCFDSETELGFYRNYFRFDDGWGSGRGYIWMKSFDAFGQMDVLQQLFGYGLDTTKLLLVNVFQDSSLRVWDNVHNEFIQYLLNGGLCMLLSYAAFILTILKRSWTIGSKSPLQIGLWMICFAYLAQSTVNINQPITTPIFFLMMILLESNSRLTEKENSNEKREEA